MSDLLAMMGEPEPSKPKAPAELVCAVCGARPCFFLGIPAFQAWCFEHAPPEFTPGRRSA